MAGLGYRDDCRGAFIGLRVLTFPSNYILENLVYMKSNPNNYQTYSSVHEYDTRNKNNYVGQYCRLKRCQDGPSCLAVKFFNKLPWCIRELPAGQFKNACKELLIKGAFYNYDEFLNCDLNVE